MDATDQAPSSILREDPVLSFSEDYYRSGELDAILSIQDEEEVDPNDVSALTECDFLKRSPLSSTWHFVSDEATSYTEADQSTGIYLEPKFVKGSYIDRGGEYQVKIHHPQRLKIGELPFSGRLLFFLERTVYTDFPVISTHLYHNEMENDRGRKSWPMRVTKQNQDKDDDVKYVVLNGKTYAVEVNFNGENEVIFTFSRLSTALLDDEKSVLKSGMAKRMTLNICNASDYKKVLAKIQIQVVSEPREGKAGGVDIKMDPNAPEGQKPRRKKRKAQADAVANELLAPEDWLNVSLAKIKTASYDDTLKIMGGCLERLKDVENKNVSA